MNDTIPVNRNRLIDLARWLTREERNRRLGQPSHWNQGVWVQGQDDDYESNVQFIPQGDELLIQGWSCGTAACAAGHIALEDGGFPAFVHRDGTVRAEPPGLDDVRGSSWTLLQYAATRVSSDKMSFPGGHIETIEEHGKRALGLDDEDAGRLFDGDNDWESMMFQIAQLTGMPEEELITLVGGDDLPADPDSDW